MFLDHTILDLFPSPRLWFGMSVTGVVQTWNAIVLEGEIRLITIRLHAQGAISAVESKAVVIFPEEGADRKNLIGYR
jgi:hypothetical protein